MLLKNLIEKIPYNLEGLNIKGLASNSKDVKKGYIFFAIKGNNLNGENFINEAIKNGASVIISSKDYKKNEKKAIHIKVGNVRKSLSLICSKFFNSKPRNIIAVTGTNGKTSVADFFYQILKLNNIHVASIGTLGIKLDKKTLNTKLTSPDVITLHKNLEILKKNKIENVIIEASSHGLDQNRLNNLNFKAGIFTNLSQDHLDYHKTMRAYLESKMVLFKALLPKKSFVITDGKLKEFSILKKISKKKKLRLIDINKEDLILKQLSDYFIKSFQYKNLLMAITAARLCGLSKKKINLAIPKILHVNGRLEFVKNFPNNVKVFIDYAHTPDALQQALKSIKKIYHSNISLVFGCGGERDFKKRPLMAKVAKNNCKQIYVTDDNPRNENPKKIREEIISNLRGSKNYFEIGNRFKAIKKAIENASPNEIILVAGKGHENIQDFGKKTIKISDKQIIKKIKLNNKKKSIKHKIYASHSNILNQITKNNKFFKDVSGLAIDDRDIKKNNLFVAIKGKKHDGNKFNLKALNKGASYIVTSNKSNKNIKKLIKVKDTINFLNRFAKIKRDQSQAKIIAITGSVGKTTLKNVLNQLLSKYYNTYASPKSFNNHYGVPTSLSNLNLGHQFGIFEVGMSKLGEINKLSRMIKPHIGIITNIGEAHLENFKNKKGIAEAKSEIINNISKGGTVILNRDDKFFYFLNKKARYKKLKVISFGKNRKSDISLISIKEKNGIKFTKVKVKNSIFDIQIKNIDVYNVLSSIAVIIELGLNLKKFLKIYKDIQIPEGRGKMYKIERYKKHFFLIDDSYNASPFSVKNAINRFSEIKKGKYKKYLLLGDMLELGKNSEHYHIKLSKVINSSDIDKVFVKGEKTLFTFKNLKKNKQGNILQHNEDIDIILKNFITNYDYLMIKGSNATGLNSISKSMIKGTYVI